MEWMYWKNKRVFIRLKKGDCYTGYVDDIDNTYGFISITDKFNERVDISISDISKIKEENYVE
jgi:small nuclear ribonucleoprotein (snRNP)-like protein